MKKITFFVETLGMLFVGLSTAKADTFSPYVSGNVGVAVGNNINVRDMGGNTIGYIPNNSSLVLTVAVGAKVNPNVRAEVELGYQGVNPKYATKSDEKASIYTGLVNGYYDIYSEGITPFVTGGVGVGLFSPTADNVNNRTTFAYQVGAGVSVPVAKNINVDATYRHSGLSEVKYNNVAFTPSNDAFLLGVRVGF